MEIALIGLARTAFKKIHNFFLLACVLSKKLVFTYNCTASQET